MEFLKHYHRKCRLLFVLFLLGFIGIGSTNETIATENPTICEGSGEKCRVSINGVPVSFSKGKDNSAIVIKL